MDWPTASVCIVAIVCATIAYCWREYQTREPATEAIGFIQFPDRDNENG